MADTLADDRLDGVKAIAAFRGEKIRRTLYLLETGRIPHGREGNRIIASKRVLREDWHRKTGAAPEAA